jgi:hypothetical protein
MAGLKRTDPEKELAVKAVRAARRKKSPRHREPDASLAPGTSYNDLGLGRKLADPAEERTWSFRVYRLHKLVRPGYSTCTTYVDANDAAGDILGEYFELSGVPREGRAVYRCEVTGMGPNAGETGGAEGRDWA